MRERHKLESEVCHVFFKIIKFVLIPFALFKSSYLFIICCDEWQSLKAFKFQSLVSLQLSLRSTELFPNSSRAGLRYVTPRSDQNKLC